MDMMSLRRMVMSQMAQGVKVITGKVTPTANQTVTIPFGETLSDYIFLIEMTADSFANFKMEQITGSKMISCVSKYKFCGEDISATSHSLVGRYNFGTLAVTGSAQQYPILYADRFEINSRPSDNASAVVLYNDYEYEYTLIKLK